jgi:hypothetical protein
MKSVRGWLLVLVGAALSAAWSPAIAQEALEAAPGVRGATQLRVVNAAPENVEIRINNAIGATTNYQFLHGQGHFAPAPLLQGIGDRVVSVRVITAQGTLRLPSKVLALRKFDPSDSHQQFLTLIFIRGAAGDDIIFTVGDMPGGVGGPVDASKPELSTEQMKVVEEILKTPALRAGN